MNSPSTQPSSARAPAASTTLDHLVINVKFEMDAAAAVFEALGFALTERGHHSLGSINHLIMFDDHYLELVGLPTGSDTLRDEVLNSRLGIDGLVFKTPDAKCTWRRLQDQGIGIGEPQSFSRPVDIDGEQHVAWFTTTRMPAGALAAGRVYFCEHLTPQWVFRPQWAVHPNGARRLSRLLVVSDDPSADAAQYAAVSGTAATSGAATGDAESDAKSGAKPSAKPGAKHPPLVQSRITLPGFEVAFASTDDYRRHYDDLAVDFGAHTAMFGAIRIEVDHIDEMRARLQAVATSGADVRVREMADAAGPILALRLGGLNALIEFVGVQ